MCEYKKYLVAHLAELVDNTICSTNVCTSCRAHDNLSKNDVHEQNSNLTPDQRAYKFWERIMTRAKCLENLTNIFSSDNQNAIAEILEKAVRDDGKDQKYNFLENMNPLEVLVEKPEQSVTHQNDYYKLNPDIIGGALLINATVFDNAKQNRQGAVKDSEYMEKLWGQLGYKVYSYKEKISKSKLMTKVLQFLTQFQNNPKWQSCVVFVGTHGEIGKLQMSDGQIVDIYDELVSKFVDSTDLIGKPKMFIFQSCQNITGQNLSQPNVADPKDIILCFPTVPGDEAKRDKYLGSWFIYTLTDIFMRNAYKLELKQMLSEVRKIMLTKIKHEEDFDQVSYWVDFSGLQPLYFNVAPIDD